MHRAHLLDATVVNVLIGHSPRGGVRGVFEMLLLHDAVPAVWQNVAADVVERAATTIDEQGLISIALEDAAHRFDTVCFVTRENAVARQWRDAGIDRLEAADGAVSVGKDLREQHAVLRGELVQFRRQGLRLAVLVSAAEGAEKFRAEALHQNDAHVSLRPRGIAGDVAREGQSRSIKPLLILIFIHLPLRVRIRRVGDLGPHKSCPRLLEQLTNAAKRFTARQGNVIGIELQVPSPRGVYCRGPAIVRQLIYHPLSTERSLRWSHGKECGNCHGQPAEDQSHARHGAHSAPVRRKPAKGHPTQTAAADQATGDDRGHRIALPNIREHLVGVEQVVYGHGIEARRELFKKVPLADEQKHAGHTAERDDDSKQQTPQWKRPVRGENKEFHRPQRQPRDGRQKR